MVAGVNGSVWGSVVSLETALSVVDSGMVWG